MNAPVVAGDVIAEKYRVDRILGSGRAGDGGLREATSCFRAGRDRAPCSPTAARARGALDSRERAAAGAQGEHVARVLDVGQLASGVAYIVTEHLDGQDLSELLRGRDQIELSEAIDWVLEACVAVAEAHAAGIVHRDLEPARLFLATPGGATLLKVLGFGASRELPGASDDRRAGAGAEELGAPLYMSPERMRSSAAVDARADVWSLGAILYRLLTGRPPFEASSLADLAPRVAERGAGAPGALRSDIPPAVDRVLLCCLGEGPRAAAHERGRAGDRARPSCVGGGPGSRGAGRAAPRRDAPSRPAPRSRRSGSGSARGRARPRRWTELEAAPETLRHGAQDKGRYRARIALIAAVASLLAILGVAATQLR